MRKSCSHHLHENDYKLLWILLEKTRLICSLTHTRLGLLGWTGASKKNNILLKLFLILSFLILLAEIGAILTISIFKANSGQLIDQTWLELNSKSHYLIQEQLTCCGLTGPSDYESSRDIDQSCYHREPLLPANIESANNLVIREEPTNNLNTLISARLQSSNRILNNQGCRQRISDWFFDNRLLILAFTGSLLLYQIISMLLTSAAISFGSRRRRHDSLEELDAGSNHHLHHHAGATYM